MIPDLAISLPIQTVISFLMAAVILNLTPGSDVMFTMACGIKGGVQSGLAAAFGIACGSLFHVLLTTFGLAAIVATSPWVFAVIKWGGVLYLLFLAYKSWTSPAVEFDEAQGRKSHWNAIKQGAITNIMNPKVALFILALLPQFTNPIYGAIGPQLLILGLIFVCSGLIITSLYGIFAGLIGDALKSYSKLLNKLSAIILGGLAFRLAWN